MHSSVMFKVGGVIMRNAVLASKAVLDRVITAEHNYVICPASEGFDNAEWERGHAMQVEAVHREACGL